MSIVVFIIAVNCGLALVLLWVATQVWQWQRSLFRLNRSLQVAHQNLEIGLEQDLEQSLERILFSIPPGMPALLRDYQQLESQLEPKFRAVAGLQGLHRLWRVTMNKRRGF